jgi:hypothetical protein
MSACPHTGDPEECTCHPDCGCEDLDAVATESDRWLVTRFAELGVEAVVQPTRSNT